MFNNNQAEPSLRLYEEYSENYAYEISDFDTQERIIANTIKARYR